MDAIPLYFWNGYSRWTGVHHYAKLEVPSYLHFPELRLQVHLAMPGIFTLVLGIELRSPCLQDPLPIQLFLALSFFLPTDKVHVYDSKLVVGTSYLCPILALFPSGQLT